MFVVISLFFFSPPSNIFFVMGVMHTGNIYTNKIPIKIPLILVNSSFLQRALSDYIELKMYLETSMIRTFTVWSPEGKLHQVSSSLSSVTTRLSMLQKLRNREVHVVEFERINMLCLVLSEGLNRMNVDYR